MLAWTGLAACGGTDDVEATPDPAGANNPAGIANCDAHLPNFTPVPASITMARIGCAMREHACVRFSAEEQTGQLGGGACYALSDYRPWLELNWQAMLDEQAWANMLATSLSYACSLNANGTLHLLTGGLKSPGAERYKPATELGYGDGCSFGKASASGRHVVWAHQTAVCDAATLMPLLAAAIAELCP